jgi:hypothetical protein
MGLRPMSISKCYQLQWVRLVGQTFLSAIFLSFQNGRQECLPHQNFKVTLYFVN